MTAVDSRVTAQLVILTRRPSHYQIIIVINCPHIPAPRHVIKLGAEPSR